MNRTGHLTLATLAIFSLAAVGCASDDEGTSSAAPDASVVPNEPSTDPATTQLGGLPLVTDVVACESFDGDPTIDVANHFNSGQPCGKDIGLDDPVVNFLGLGSEECADGTILYWNDVGWGPSEGNWTYSTDGLPPDEAFNICRGE